MYTTKAGSQNATTMNNVLIALSSAQLNCDRERNVELLQSVIEYGS